MFFTCYKAFFIKKGASPKRKTTIVLNYSEQKLYHKKMHHHRCIFLLYISFFYSVLSASTGLEVAVRRLARVTTSAVMKNTANNATTNTHTAIGARYAKVL